MTTAILDPCGEEITRDSLWASLENFLNAAFVLFGSPLVLAEKAWLRIAEYKRARDWLFRCEELFRRALYIDARELGDTHAPTTPAKQGASTSVRVCHPAEPFDSERPETWRASFQIAPYGPRAAQPRRARKPRVDWNTTHCAYGLARRFEALLRAWNDRPRHVRRMARLLLIKRAAIAAALAQPTRSFQRKQTTSGDLTVADAASYIRATDTS